MTVIEVIVAAWAIVLFLAVVRGVLVSMSTDEPYEKPEWNKPGLDDMRMMNSETTDNSSGETMPQGPKGERRFAVFE
jgi:hypothetical protein